MNHKTPISYEQLYSLYIEERKSPAQIALVFGCSGPTIANRLREFQLPVRSGSEALKGRQNTWAHKAADKNRGKRRPGIGGRPKGCIGWNKGLTKQTDTRLSQVGKQKEQHWAWKGGVSDVNVLIRQSSEYKQWRRLVFIRDNYSCQTCSERGGDIEAHHISHFACDIDRRFDINNGKTLCVSCHQELHRKERSWQKMDPEQ